MHIQIETSPAETLSADALALICFEAAEKRPPGGVETPAVASTRTADPDIADQSGWLADLRSTGEFTGKLYEIAILYRPAGVSAKRIVVIGGGKRDKFSAVEARRAAGALVRKLKENGIRTIALLIDPEFIGAAVEGALLGHWEPKKYKTDAKQTEKQVDTFTLAVPGGDAGSLEQAVHRAQVIAESQNLSRDLANEPANKLVPAALAEAAQQMASEVGLQCDLLDRGGSLQTRHGCAVRRGTG